MKCKRRWKKFLQTPLAVLGLLAASVMPAHAAVYTVGPGTNCDYSAMRDALDAVELLSNGTAELRIAYPVITSLNYTSGNPDSAVELNDPQATIIITGGFSDCVSSNPVAGEYTVFRQIESADNLTHSLLAIENDNSNLRSHVEFHHIKMEGHYNSTLGIEGSGGALDIRGNVTVELHDTSISGFGASLGGGVYVDGSGTDRSKFPKLILTDGSSLTSNTAELWGGGISASSAQVVMAGATVGYNDAIYFGGGLALFDAKDAGSVGTASNVALLLEDTGGKNFITGNTAGDGTYSSSSGLGGGVYSSYGQIRADSRWANNFQHYITNNAANAGGAIYIYGANDPAGGPYVQMVIYDAQINNNSARGKGGALYLKNAVTATIGAGAGPGCWQMVYLPPPLESFSYPTPCSTMWGNSALGTDGGAGIARGGAIYVTNTRTDGMSRSIAHVYRTWFSSNEDPLGLAAVAAADNTSELVFKRSIFTNNAAEHDNLNSALIYVHTGRGLEFTYNTVLDSNTSTRMFSIDGGTLDATGSILWGTVDRTHPFHFVWFKSGGATMVHNGCIMVRASDDGTAGVPVPAYSEAFAWGSLLPPDLDENFAPSSFSPALDYCDEYGFTPIRDAFGEEKSDVPGMENVYWSWDLGAVEQSDAIYANGFGNRPEH